MQKGCTYYHKHIPCTWIPKTWSGNFSWTTIGTTLWCREKPDLKVYASRPFWKFRETACIGPDFWDIDILLMSRPEFYRREQDYEDCAVNSSREVSSNAFQHNSILHAIFGHCYRACRTSGPPQRRKPFRWSASRSAGNGFLKTSSETWRFLGRIEGSEAGQSKKEPTSKQEAANFLLPSRIINRHPSRCGSSDHSDGAQGWGTLQLSRGACR